MVLAFFTVVLGVGGAIGLAAFVLEPIVGMGPLTKRLRYQTADLLWLSVLLMYPLGFLTWLQRRPDSLMGRSDLSQMIAGVSLLIMVVAIWRMSLIVLQQRQVIEPVRRAVFSAVAMPLAVISLLVFTGLWIAFVGSSLHGEWNSSLVAATVTALAVAVTSRLLFVWSLKLTAKPIDAAAGECSPFDADPPSTSDRSD
ncbi:MAG: hypothetical protein KDA44_00045 [Planctomycetales bacterium]|nr:hypothetical protein [Planctomycetales bacterium]